ncbi:MAG: efflux RND transporter permease subunit [Verrucomicrobiota bacterium]
MEKLIQWCSRNHVAGNFMMLAILMGGIITWFQLRKEIFPELTLDAVSVQVIYENATPDEVEEGVVIPIEEAIADVEGIRRMTSRSSRGYGTVTVEVENGYATRDVMDEIKTEVDAIDNFAEEAEEPIVEQVQVQSQVLSITISADTDEKTLRGLGERVRDDLLTYVPEAEGFGDRVAQMLRGETQITRVELAAARPYEISIEVPENTLRKFDLSLQEVANAVRRSSLDLPAGSMRTSAGEVVVRAMGKRYTEEDFASVVVKTRADGSQVYLGDLAQIEDGFEDIDLNSRFDRQPSILVNVFRVGEQDTLVIAKAVKQYLAQAKDLFPEGITLEIWNDQSKYLQGRLDLMQRNALAGFLLVMLVLAVFLRPSLAMLVALGIPVAFAGGIWMMPELSVSINMISLFAFILVLGIVVDDAIVVGENVYTQIQQGIPPREAAWRGTHEVGVIVIFGVLTTAAAFTPMLGLSGASGKIWPNIPLVVIPTLLFSLVQSKLVLPAHLAFLKPRDPHKKVGPITRWQRGVSDGLEKFIQKRYQPFIQRALGFRYLVIGCFGVAFCVILGLIAGGWIKTEFFPQVEGDVISAKIEMPLGAPFVDTEEAVRRLESAAWKLNEEFQDREGNPAVVHVLATSGGQPFTVSVVDEGGPQGSYLGEVTVELVAAATRDVAAERILQRWRELAGVIPGVLELSYITETARGGAAIDLAITGSDLRQLDAATQHVKERLEDYPGVFGISDSNRLGREEIRFRELTPAGKALGLRLDDIALQVRHAFFGDEAQRLQRGKDEIKVMVRYPEEERRSVNSLEEMKIRTPQGMEVPLLQVAIPEPGRGASAILRTDRQRTVNIQADVDSEVANANQVVGRFTKEVLDPLPEEFPGVRWTFEGEQKDQNESITQMGQKFLLALLMMYVLMAVPLRSYIQPLIIMSVIPFGILGAVVGHLILGLELSIMSMCGIVALAGVVVNDSLVLVDYVNRHRKESATVREAAVRAASARFRAITLTSLTTFAGLMPMLLEQDLQAKFLIPMAVSLSFGILFATLITLILVPSVYLVLEDIKALLGRLFGKDLSPDRALEAAEAGQSV